MEPRSHDQAGRGCTKLVFREVPAIPAPQRRRQAVLLQQVVPDRVRVVVHRVHRQNRRLVVPERGQPGHRRRVGVGVLGGVIAAAAQDEPCR